MRRKHFWIEELPIIAIKDGVIEEYDNVSLFIKQHPDLSRNGVVSALNPMRIDHHSHRGWIVRFKDDIYNRRNDYVCPKRSVLCRNNSK